jgi:hypothetical protein
LGGLLDIAELYRPGAAPRYYAPWKDVPRGVGALLQGVFAHAAVVDFWRIHRRTVSGPERMLAEFEFAHWYTQTTLAGRILAAAEELTEHGHAFVRILAGTLAAWEGEDVAAQAAEAARLCAADHRATWRLRNLPADIDLVERLLPLLRAGEPCPAGSLPEAADTAMVAPLPKVDEKQPRLPGAPSAAVRARLLVSALTGTDHKSPMVAPSPADVAYVSGNSEATTLGYLARIETEPADDAAWSGLAMAYDRFEPSLVTRTMVARPELVRALYMRLRSGSQWLEPLRIAAWLAAGEPTGEAVS